MVISQLRLFLYNPARRFFAQFMHTPSLVPLYCRVKILILPNTSNNSISSFRGVSSRLIVIILISVYHCYNAIVADSSRSKNFLDMALIVRFFHLGSIFTRLMRLQLKLPSKSAFFHPPIRGYRKRSRPRYAVISNSPLHSSGRSRFSSPFQFDTCGSGFLLKLVDSSSPMPSLSFSHAYIPSIRRKTSSLISRTFVIFFSSLDIAIFKVT